MRAVSWTASPFPWTPTPEGAWREPGAVEHDEFEFVAERSLLYPGDIAVCHASVHEDEAVDRRDSTPRVVGVGVCLDGSDRE